ncbi:chaperonin GroL, partial [Reticulomyxa filosa]
MAILTGCQVVSENLGQKTEDVQLSDLDCCGRIMITKDDTTILNGPGKREDIDERISQLRTQIEETDSTYEKEKLGERLGKLSSGVGVIRVGGSSEVEVNEKKHRINDALNATRAAVDQSVVIGRGIVLLYSTKVLDSIEFDNEDQRVGIDIVRKAIQLPAIAIIQNSGKEGSVFAGKCWKIQKQIRDMVTTVSLINDVIYTNWESLTPSKWFVLLCEMLQVLL